ncbi:hypothetical protein T12_16121 [Trichinella patagoniensis]|uniref:Uncharacterized protein n=1 Tax=Trichinella patagoniensis TaxID=990121 RepID=A0A0V0ZIA5_9BILA|nr:hypothetical protein T12_16121 [Trichinella patagoniensis]
MVAAARRASCIYCAYEKLKAGDDDDLSKSPNGYLRRIRLMQRSCSKIDANAEYSHLDVFPNVQYRIVVCLLASASRNVNSSSSVKLSKLTSGKTKKARRGG